MEEKDIREILEVVNISKPKCPCEPATWAFNLLRHLPKLFKSERINFYFSDSHHRQIDLNKMVSIGLEQYYNNLYSQYYHKLSLFCSPVPHQLANRIVGQVKDVIPYSTWTRLPFYNEFLKPQNIHHEMIIYLKTETKLLGVVTFFRSKHEHDFSTLDMQKAHILAPYITSALEKMELYQSIEFERQLVDNSHKLLKFGLWIMDFDFQTVYCNSVANNILQLIQGHAGDNTKHSNREQILFDIKQDCITLRKHYFTNQKLVTPSKTRTIKCEKIGRMFLVRAAVIALTRYGMSTPYFIISFKDGVCSDSSYVDIENMRELYHLSERELEIAGCITLGLTNNEIANKLMISRFTVQHHLQNIYDKTEIRNRTALSRLALLLSE